MSMTGAPIPECLTSSPGANCQPVSFEVLCDETGPFLRRYQINCDTGAVVGTSDTELNGVTAYTPVGAVIVCAGDAEVARVFRQHREELVGAGVWGRPSGASSVTVKCRALQSPGSATITDAAANVTPLFVGDEETWASPDGTPLSGTFTVTTTGPGDYITIVWLETA